MQINELIESNGHWVSRRNLRDLFGATVGHELYNLGFNALGEEDVQTKEVKTQLTAKIVDKTSVCIQLTPLIQFVGRVAATPQSNYTQAQKSHELWATRYEFLIEKLKKERLVGVVGALKIAYTEALENAE